MEKKPEYKTKQTKTANKQVTKPTNRGFEMRGLEANQLLTKIFTANFDPFFSCLVDLGLFIFLGVRYT